MKLTIKDNLLEEKSKILNLLSRIIEEKGLEGKSITFNFRDPGYSVEKGGFHPVEIRINKDAEIEYITEFAYNYILPFEELGKCLDFDFEQKLLRCSGFVFPIQGGQEIFKTWQENFCHYYQMNAYQLCVQID